MTEEQKLKMMARLHTRKERYLRALSHGISGQNVLLIGDRPGPGAPKDPGYIHTPFYSTKYSSGWLNGLLDEHQIPESGLVWINSADENGNPADPTVLTQFSRCATIVLGGNAEKWYLTAGASKSQPWIKVTHPQYHKRFRNKERYELIDELERIMRP
jgi:hypothetical protein